MAIGKIGFTYIECKNNISDATTPVLVVHIALCLSGFQYMKSKSLQNRDLEYLRVIWCEMSRHLFMMVECSSQGYLYLHSQNSSRLMSKGNVVIYTLLPLSFDLWCWGYNPSYSITLWIYTAQCLEQLYDIEDVVLSTLRVLPWKSIPTR